MENADWFRGDFRETKESLQAVEERLGVSLSEEMKWLLQEWGYGDAVGIENLSECVTWTLTVRGNRPGYPMPNQYVLLYDWQDSGIVLMDTMAVDSDGEPRVLWVTSPPIDGEPDDVVQSYATFAEWSVYRLDEEKDFLEGAI